MPNRTRQREWEEAQAKVAVTERQLSNHQEAVHNLRWRLADLQDTWAIRHRELERRRLDLQCRQREGRAAHQHFCEAGFLAVRLSLRPKPV